MSRELLHAMRSAGYCEYGAEITSEWVRQVCEIDYPTEEAIRVSTVEQVRKMFNAVALEELGATDYVRNILLGEGKYLGGTKDGYRVYLPSETKEQVEQYMKVGDSKYRRAQKLLHNLPPAANAAPDNTAARIAAKLNGRRKQF